MIYPELTPYIAKCVAWMFANPQVAFYTSAVAGACTLGVTFKNICRATHQGDISSIQSRLNDASKSALLDRCGALLKAFTDDPWASVGEHRALAAACLRDLRGLIMNASPASVHDALDPGTWLLFQDTVRACVPLIVLARRTTLPVGPKERFFNGDRNSAVANLVRVFRVEVPR